MKTPFANSLACPSQSLPTLLLLYYCFTTASLQVAGVTLLAFANGAGDVAVTVAAAIASNRGTQVKE
jgi:hypothetical protein